MTDCLQTVSLTKGPIDEVEEFTYLGSVLSTTQGSEQDVEARLGKARTVFRRWINCGNPKSLEEQLKYEYSTNVKTVLLYASESWTFTQRTINTLHVFINQSMFMQDG